MSQTKPIKPLGTPEPVIIITPHKGQYQAKTCLPPHETAQLLSNLSLKFAIEAGKIEAYQESDAKIVNPNTGRLAIQGN